MRIDIHHHIEPSTEVLDRLDYIGPKVDLILKNQETIMIDTTRILAEVARARTELASYKALSDAQTQVISDQAAALKAAIAANDPAAIAQVQADLDKAAVDLSADNDAAAQAIAANTPKP